MVTSFDSFENLDYSGGDDDDDNDYDDDLRSLMPPPDHIKHTYLTAEERIEVYGLREPSAQSSSFSPGNT